MVKALGVAMLAAVTLAAAGAAGCKDMTPDAEALAERACACKDKTCGDAVLDDFVDLLKSNKHSGGDEVRLQAAGKRIGDCVYKAGTSPDDLLAKLKPYEDK